MATISQSEENEKRKAVRGYEIGKRCAPEDIDNWPNPEIDKDVAGSYPTPNPAVPYTNETRTHKVRIAYQDGHHPDDRGNLTDAQIGVGTPHEHDDWKRSPPEILDQDPKAARLGPLAENRVPDNSAVYAQVDGGDQIGYDPATRAKYHGEGPLGPGDKLEFLAKKTKNSDLRNSDVGVAPK